MVFELMLDTYVGVLFITQAVFVDTISQVR